MNDLPDNTPSLSNSTQTSGTNPAQAPVMGRSGGAEGESFPIAPELPIKAAVPEIDLPKEVQAVGVSQTPTTVQLPQLVQQEGVQSIGHNVPATPTNGSSITLPLNDQQIEQAMKLNVKQSIRWLAEWCVYQVKKAQQVVSGHKH